MRKPAHSCRRLGPTLVLGLAALLGSPTAGATEGRVITRLRQTFQGQIQLLSNAVLIVDVAHTRLLQVPLTNLHSLQFLAGPAPFPEASDTLSGWQSADVGPVPQPGASRVRTGGIQLRATTLEHAGGQDSIRFTYQTLRGNGEIAGRLLRMKGWTTSARAGLMIRSSLQPDAPSMFIGQTLTGGVTQWREHPGTAHRQHTRRPVYDRMRLKRDGDWCYGYASPDGLHWRLVDKAEIPMDKEILVGCALAGGSVSQGLPAECWFDDVRTGRGLRLHGFVPQVTLESGSLLVEDVAYSDEGELYFQGPYALPSVPLRHAARLDFQWRPARLEAQVPAGRRGALLASGEFFEGDFKSLREGTCTMSTVLFGLRRFDAHHDIVSIVLGQSEVRPANAEIRTWSGSILRGRLLSLTETGLVLQEPLLGRVFIPGFALKEVSQLDG